MYNRRYRRRKKANKLPLFMLVALFVMCTFIFIHKSKYNLTKEFKKFYTMSKKTLYVPAFAHDLAVLDKSKLIKIDNDFGDESLLLTDDKGYILYDNGIFKRRAPASTTKIMTALLALKYGDLDDVVKITSEAMISEEGASLAGLEVGDSITLKNLLYALLLPSGNDAANAIALYISGSLQDFYDLMNIEAKSLGANQTNFKNAHGLTEDDHYTTAYDLYLIFNAAMKYDLFRQITSTSTYSVKYKDALGNDVDKIWANGNLFLSKEKLLPKDFYVTGGKTGTTLSAGACLVLSTQKENKDEHNNNINNYVSIVLHAVNKDKLYSDMQKLLETQQFK